MRTVVLVLLVLAVIFVGGSYLLDPHVEVSRSVVIDAPPEAIHPWIDDLRRWPQWWPFDADDPTREYKLGPITSGVGATRSWTSEETVSGTQTITESDPAHGVVLELSLEGVDDHASVAIAFAPEGGGTRVTWSDRFDVGPNPFYRWMSLRADALVGDSFDKGLAKLKQLVEAGPQGSSSTVDGG